ncbi:MAG: cyclophilin-like fold protein [Leucobacter sp.]
MRGTHRTSQTIRSVALLALVACATLTACSTADPDPDRAPAVATEPALSATPVPTTETTEAATEPSGEVVTETRVRIIIGDETLDATLRDNPAAESLIERLPLTLEFSDYGGQEVLAEPPQQLTMEGMPSGESAPAGTIGWYAPGRAIVLYYADVGRYNGIVRIGEMDGDLSILTGWASPRSVTIERAG